MVTALENITTLVEALRQHKDVLDKKTIAQTYKHIGNSIKSSIYFPEASSDVILGDDAAAILQKDGSHLLLAAEGIVTPFLNQDPWFAGYSAVMVNISDICAMGGLPIAVTDTIYASDADDSKAVWEGMMTASKTYGVPIVGGHTCYRSKCKALSVSILGKASKNLLTSFNAKPNDVILLALDQNGAYYKDYPFWNASTNTQASTLQQRVKLPYEIANNQWSYTAKDISMGGIIGTLLMLLNSSKVGAHINLESITKPNDIPWEKWLVSFPSYGYLLSCTEQNVTQITNLFLENGINCDRIGNITTKNELIISYKNQNIKF